MQKKECCVLDGHPELGHVSDWEHWGGHGDCSLQTAPLGKDGSNLTGQGWSKERMVGFVEEGKEAVPGFHN